MFSLPTDLLGRIPALLIAITFPNMPIWQDGVLLG